MPVCTQYLTPLSVRRGRGTRGPADSRPEAHPALFAVRSPPNTISGVCHSRAGAVGNMDGFVEWSGLGLATDHSLDLLLDPSYLHCTGTYSRSLYAVGGWCHGGGGDGEMDGLAGLARALRCRRDTYRALPYYQPSRQVSLSKACTDIQCTVPHQIQDTHNAKRTIVPFFPPRQLIDVVRVELRIALRNGHLLPQQKT